MVQNLQWSETMAEIAKLQNALHTKMPSLHLADDPQTLHTYGVDGVEPRLLVTPASVDEAAQTVAQVHQHSLTLLARGGGSHMHLGDLSERIDVLLETKRLNRLLEHEAADLTCRVEAGITLATLQAYLARSGQRLALDPLAGDQATIGGLLASNASGPRRLRYGSARDQVIGLSVVQASGEVAQSGGHVVKNVAGYDLNKLYIGSLGTLGVIVEANFKLQPLPASECTLLLTYASLEDAMQMVIATIGSRLTPSALELMDARTMQQITRTTGLSMPTSGYTLALNFEGSQISNQRQNDEAHILARQHHAMISEDLQDGQQERFWQAVREQTCGALICKVVVLVSELAAYIRQVEGICSRHGLATEESAMIAHAGSGILYLSLPPEHAHIAEAILEMRNAAQQARGSLIVERCPTELKRTISVWGEPRADFQYMQRLKQQFDPTGTFVRGRFLNGL
jgi:glycolate oxidase FAD binding subunit